MLPVLIAKVSNYTIFWESASVYGKSASVYESASVMGKALPLWEKRFRCGKSASVVGKALPLWEKRFRLKHALQFECFPTINYFYRT